MSAIGADRLQYKSTRLQLEMLGCDCRISGCKLSCSAAIADCGYAMQAARPRGAGRIVHTSKMQRVA
eukprot:scaffold42111_cov58-Phaeocystis_antarctica.AAC.1